MTLFSCVCKLALVAVKFCMHFVSHLRVFCVLCNFGCHRSLFLNFKALLEELSTRLKRRSELEGSLFDAFQNNDIDAVKSLLEQLGPTDAARVINSTPSGISTLLYRASHTGKLRPTDAARVINSTPSGISTLLYRASHTGKLVSR